MAPPPGPASQVAPPTTPRPPGSDGQVLTMGPRLQSSTAPNTWPLRPLQQGAAFMACSLCSGGQAWLLLLPHLWGCCGQGPGPGPICPRPPPCRPRCRTSVRRRKSCSAHPGTARCRSPSRGLWRQEGGLSGTGFLRGGASRPVRIWRPWVPSTLIVTPPQPLKAARSPDGGRAAGQTGASELPQGPGGRPQADRRPRGTHPAASCRSSGGRTGPAPRGRPSRAQSTR